ncbi:hypothetical protein ABW19_dt0202232 [Dactylella cylindrospora]|nr:hypothetical protein ABW19_dt0202232 [Dactylella cylindrospora]
MGPKNQYTAHPRDFDESDIERTEEYLSFLDQVKMLHEERGSTSHFNPEPDIQRKKIDLLKLYKKVTEAGGYTKVSEQTGLWKEFAVQFNPPQHNSNIGFVLKTHYKNVLGAWECKDFWKSEPPPKEALEELTAAGSELLGRKIPPSADTTVLQTRRSGAGEAASPGSGTSTSGRTLREAPPKRQFFQPELSTPKPRTVTTSNQSPVPQATTNGKASTPGGSNSSSTPNTNPVQEPPMTKLIITPLETPYSNPAKFAKMNKSGPSGPKRIEIHFPAQAGYPPPSLLQKAALRIACGIPDEVDHGLGFLLESSFQENNGILFTEIPSIPVSLLELMELGFEYMSTTKTRELAKNKDKEGISSEEAALGRQASLVQIGEIFDSNFRREKVHPALKAALILRNLTMDDGNCRHLALHVQKARQVLTSCWTNPLADDLEEFRINSLEIISHMCKYLSFPDEPEIAKILWEGVLSNDRHTLMVSLSGLTKLAVQDDTNQIGLIPPNVLEQIQLLLMTGDGPLLAACLDFMYQYTLNEGNAVNFCERDVAHYNLSQLTRLLSYGATEFPPITKKTEQPAKPKKQLPETIPELPADLIQEILSMSEPNRAIAWMRACFEYNPDSEITQIALWQSYQIRFAGYIQQGPRPQPLLHANDFIKNVNVAFKSAHAMMLPAQGSQPQRFVIRGIAPREAPMGPDGTIYVRCEWMTVRPDKDKPVSCLQYFKDVKTLYAHTRDAHTFLAKGSEVKEQQCNWKKCQRFPSPGTTEKMVFHKHLMAHMPQEKKLEPGVKDSKPSPPNGASQTPKRPADLPDVPWTLEITDADKAGNPTGVAYMAARVLLNLSRQVKTEVGFGNLFLLRETLFDKYAANPVLVGIICDILIELHSLPIEPQLGETAGADVMAIDD